MIRRLSPFAFLLLLSLACSLLAEPRRPVIPTPPATAPPLRFETLNLITNPVSSVVPTVDPDIEALVNAVSRQNLLAYVQQLDSFGTRNIFSETQRDDYGIGAARRWIFSEFERVGGGRLQVRYQDFPVNFGGLFSNQQNVIATLPGVGPHPGVIVLMAHYDSRTIDPGDGVSPAPGAADNASGVAVLIETARLLSSRNWSQTIIFAAFSAEEQGTHGSRFFVQDLMLDGAIIDAAINNDIVGGRPGIPQSIRIFSPGPDNSNARQLARYMDILGAFYVPTFRTELVDGMDRQDRFSDHREFINAGVAAVRLTESVEDFSVQHTGRDTWDRLDYDYLTQVTRLNVATLANLVGAPAPPSAPTVAPMADPGAFILSWAPDFQAAGYAISFRLVGSDQYEPFRYVNVNEAGNVALTGYDPLATYAVSLAALDAGGRMSFFSPEVIVGPGP